MVERGRVVLVGLVAFGLAGCRSDPPAPTLPDPDGPRLAWVFEAPHPGSLLAAPTVTADGVYLAASHARGFEFTGTVYALDLVTGRPMWTFDRDGTMLPTASTPLVVGKRLFVGEGMHGHTACRLHCLDVATGKPRWDFPTADHIEGGPAESDGLVIFPAGNDGLHAAYAETGKPHWTFRADLHIDNSPSVSGGRVFVGGGRSRRYQNYQVACLDAKTGKPVWRTPVNLPAWGNPLVVGDRVYIGLGNGRLNEPARPPETPAGAMVCLDTATGKVHWTFPTGDAVFGRPALIGDRVIFGSRDGNVYGVDSDGREAFRVSTGGPVTAGVASLGRRAYAVSVAGRIVCLDPASGTEHWRHELARPGVTPHVFGSSVVEFNRLYVAAEMTAGRTGIVSLFCFDLPRPRGSER